MKYAVTVVKEVTRLTERAQADSGINSLCSIYIIRDVHDHRQLKMWVQITPTPAIETLVINLMSRGVGGRVRVVKN